MTGDGPRSAAAGAIVAAGAAAAGGWISEEGGRGRLGSESLLGILPLLVLSLSFFLFLAEEVARGMG